MSLFTKQSGQGTLILSTLVYFQNWLKMSLLRIVNDTWHLIVHIITSTGRLGTV